ncbi:MAG: AmmeMemoRadiSam system protein B [Chloroflexota bacterium]|nr:MAG: AmmeMemoRadiSam system protein B [Chloroflexota bacterium]
MDVRPSAIAGRWYPADSEKLAASVDGYIQEADLPEIKGQVIAIMAPHAGHIYSGPVAGYAFSAVRGLQPDIVAIVSPMHQPYAQPLLTSAHQAYQTPLGSIPIDQEAVSELNSALEEDLGFGLTPVRNDAEHSLEIEIPFLQRVLRREFRLLPVMVRDQTAKVGQVLGKSLAIILAGKNPLLVASTDLSHFYNQTQAVQLDSTMLDQVASFNPMGVLQVEEQGKGFACGRNALAAVLWAARDLGANHVQILKHATSGDVTGDYSGVVGYAAAVVTRYMGEEDRN